MRGFYVVCFLSLLCVQPSRAYYVLNELPNTFDINSQSLSVRTLGGSCLTSIGVQDGVPCSASLLPLVPKARFFATGQIGNGYDAAKTTNDVLTKPLSKKDLESLFTDKNHLQADGSLKFTFLSSSFAAEFAPYQSSLRGILRNSSYPVVGIHAMNERRLLFSTGRELWKNITVGSHLRIFQRRFIHDEFQMFQAVTNSGSLVKVNEQNGVALDPSVTWWTEDSTQSRWTVGVENIEWVNRPVESLPSKPRLVAGWGAAVPVALGLFEVGIDARPADSRSLNVRDLSVGSNYRLGGIQFLAGLNQYSVNGGVRFSLKQIDLGVAYWSTRWPSGTADNYQQSLLTQFSFGF